MTCALVSTLVEYARAIPQHSGRAVMLTWGWIDEIVGYGLMTHIDGYADLLDAVLRELCPFVLVRPTHIGGPDVYFTATAGFCGLTLKAVYFTDERDAVLFVLRHA